MRLDKPRLDPLPADQLDPKFIPAAARGQAPNVLKTLARYPALLERWMGLARYILEENSLPAREREIAILRTGWLCQSGYEFGQHTRIGKQAGLSDAEVVRITRGPDAEGWSDLDRTLLRATDELCNDAFISDATWGELQSKWSEQQMVDLIFTVGQYNLVSMALNSLGVQLDEGVSGIPKG